MDTLRYCAGEIVEVSAYAARVVRGEFDYPPTLTAALRFESGAVGKVTVTFEAYTPYLLNLHLYGSRGTRRNNRLYAEALRGQTGYAVVPTLLPDSGEVAHHPVQAEVDDFVSCVLEGRESRTALADASRTHEVCLAPERSAVEARPVTLPLRA